MNMKTSTRLASKFIKNNQDLQNTKVRSAYGNVASIFGIICNVLLFGGKLFAGIITKSVAITADAMNNLTDASSNIISLLGFRLAARPADKDHPYGHGRYEYLSALCVAALILVIGVELLKSSVEKIIHPQSVDFGILTAIILVVSIIVKLIMAKVNRDIGSDINSNTLIAAADDSRNDVISTGAVLISAIIAHFAHINLDGIMGLLVALFILYSGLMMLKDTLSPILGQAPSPELVRHINEKVLSYDGVLGIHDLIVHDYGVGRQFASVHVEVAAETDVMITHDILDNIERDFMENDGLNVVCHLDPISTTNPLVGELRQYISVQIKSIHPELTIHDLRIVEGTTHTNVIFDCLMPYSVKMTESELRAKIVEIVKKKDEKFECVITVDKEFSSMG